jgi:hypothetical protein
VSRSVDNAQPSADVDEATVAPAPRAWDRLRGWALPLGGALAGLLYGTLVVSLRPGAPLLMLTLGGMAVGLCGVALYRILEPLVRPGAAAQRADRDKESTRLRELEREKQLVLKAIREIEHDFQMRKISEADHREQTQRYRARALRLINQIDAGDDFKTLIEQELKTRLMALEAARTACAGCGTPNEADASFCKKCGKTLAAAAPAAEGAP